MKIASLSKDPLGKNLIVSYKYYVSLLENMTLEEKKNTNGYNIKIKDFQIDKLTNQINIRDQLIHQAIEELRKKNEKLKINENIKKVEEIKSNAYKLLPLLSSHNKPQAQSSQVIETGHNTNRSLNTPRKTKQSCISDNEIKAASYFQKYKIQNNPYNHNPTHGSNKHNQIVDLDYSGYRHANIDKEPRRFKTKTTEVREQMKNLNVSNLKLNMINNNYPNSKVYFSNGNIMDRSTDIGISFDINNIQTNELNSSNNDSANNSMLERDLDKKTKHILKFQGNKRARSNPYLR